MTRVTRTAETLCGFKATVTPIAPTDQIRASATTDEIFAAVHDPHDAPSVTIKVPAAWRVRLKGPGRLLAITQAPRLDKAVAAGLRAHGQGCVDCARLGCPLGKLIDTVEFYETGTLR